MKRKLWFARLFGIGMFLTVLSLSCVYSQPTYNWKKIGPWGGDIRDIKMKVVADTVLKAGGKKDSLLVANYGSGVFITDSTAGSGLGYWVARNNGLPSLKVTCLGVRAVGQGDTLFVGLDGFGIYKSTNGGLTWDRGFNLGGEMGTKAVYAIAVHPNTSWIAYAATNDGLWKTTNFGGTWTSVFATGAWTNVIMHEYATQKIYATTGSTLYRSTDLGTTWGGPYALSSTINGIALAYSAFDTLYAGLADGTVKEVTFPGDVFTTVNKSNGLVPGNSINSLTIIPTRAVASNDSIMSNDTIYVATNDGVFKSDKKGATWTQVNAGLTGTMSNVIYSYPMRKGLINAPYTTKFTYLYVGTKFNGLFADSTAKGVGSVIYWNSYNDSLPVGGLRAVSVKPGSSETVYAGGGYNLGSGIANGALWKTTTATSAATWTRVLPTAVDATNGQYIKSVATSWKNVDYILVADSINGIIRSTDGGTTWTSLPGTTGAVYVYYNRMHSDTAFAVRNDVGTWRVLRSYDAGATFTPLTQTFTYPITSLTIDSAAAQTLYVTTWGSGVYKSTNDGNSFTAINKGTLNLNVFSLAVDSNNNYLVIGTEFGLYKSIDKGANWLDDNAGGAGFALDKATNVFATRDTIWAVLQNTGIFYRSKISATNWAKAPITLTSFDPNPGALVDNSPLLLKDIDMMWKWSDPSPLKVAGYTASESKAVYARNNTGASIDNYNASVTLSDSLLVWIPDTLSAIRGTAAYDIPVFVRNAQLADSFSVSVNIPSSYMTYSSVQTTGTKTDGLTLNVRQDAATRYNFSVQKASAFTTGDGVLFNIRVAIAADAANALNDSIPLGAATPLAVITNLYLCNMGPSVGTLDSTTQFKLTGGVAGTSPTQFLIDRSKFSVPGIAGLDSVAAFWLRKLPNDPFNGLNGTIPAGDSIITSNRGGVGNTYVNLLTGNYNTERIWNYAKNTGRSMVLGIGSDVTKLIYPYHTYIDMPGKQIRTGDAIGAFYYRNDSLVCAGWGTWDPVLGCVFTVWGDDDRTPLKDGFVTNEPLMIKVYDSRYKRVWDADVVTVSTGSLTFTPNGITKIDSLIAKKFNSMRCIIRAGWNLISANVVPRWPEVETIFKSSVATNSLTLVKDEDGLVYWPQIGLNQLITWDITKAYWAYFYTNGTSDTLYMKGANIDIAKNSIPLRAGWNLLPYWGTRAVSVVTALADLAVSNPDMLVKDQSGNIYWPSVGFNSIGSMNIGQGYELYLTTAVPRFQYPSTVASYSIKSFNTGRGIPEVADLSYGEVSKYNAKFSPVSQVLGLEINGYAMKQGDEIGIFTKDGLCVGSAKYNKSNTNVVAITVFGDMPMSEKDAKIGAVEGDVLTIKLFCKADGKEYTPVVNSVNWKVGSVSGLSYKTNTIGAVKITVKGASSSALPTEFAIQQNYPNPFNPTTNIKYALPVDGLVKIKVYDMLGREIKTLVNTQQPAGYYTIEWDATNNMGRKVASGVYFYQIEASNFNKTVKMMLMK